MMKKSTKALVAGAGVVAGAAAFTHGLTNYMIRVALDRDSPKSALRMTKHLAAEVFSDPLYQKALEDARELAEIPHERVEITARDGERLVGHWFPVEQPRRILLAMHGWRSAWHRDFGGIAPFWQQNGCSVLYVEQRGQNASGGDYMGFGMLERYDCLDWLQWLESTQGNVLPVYLVGLSMGASTVLMATGFDLSAPVRGVIADCGFTSAHAIWNHVCRENLHMPYRLHRLEAEHLCKKKLHIGTQAYSTLEALKKCTVPVLFIHGEADRFVPPEMTYENFEACAGPKRLFTVPGAAHGMSYYTDPEGYQREILDFWQEVEI